jgi:hypothetical protein
VTYFLINLKAAAAVLTAPVEFFIYESIPIRHLKKHADCCARHQFIFIFFCALCSHVSVRKDPSRTERNEHGGIVRTGAYLYVYQESEHSLISSNLH